MSYDRRDLLKLMGAASLLPGASLALGRAPTDRRLIIIFQRGAQDGLQALVPHSDPLYYRYRPGIAIPKPGTANGALDLDGRFGLHPALTEFHKLWQAGDLAPIPAIASRYRERSHFDGQNLIENGSGTPFGANDGFLNRALQGFDDADARLGMAFGYTVPLALRGEAGVRSWSPSTFPEADGDFLMRLADSYRDDPVFAQAIEEGIAPMEGMADLSQREKRQAVRAQTMAPAAQAAADALSTADGPRIALIESNGWDTHNAITGRLDRLFADLDQAMGILRTGMADVWDDTLIITMSEFGRTARENGSAGTDHGTGGVSFVAGGAVEGGKIHGGWPGLGEGALYEDRDVAPVNSLESLLKAALGPHMGLPMTYLDMIVLPDSDAIGPMKGLLG
ncbi:DUF1501 domain-containing protein [Parvularcula marina]|uniref:DUF1501 domain-containing protein n=1 Tax=Parvularcula marina TaxID=2292771 RepID=A0A371RGC9_9PROT|nr:DUF1501 domain-containing protein [Parvularcula marina]RFB04482.1 DUF1501 domain-containing protein [Parvularcula marina]